MTSGLAVLESAFLLPAGFFELVFEGVFLVLRRPPAALDAGDLVVLVVAMSCILMIHCRGFKLQLVTSFTAADCAVRT